MFKAKPCLVCIEKNARISDLKEQLKHFQTILNPPQRINKYELEETAVMNGGGQEIDPATLEAEEKENSKIQQEVDAFFSGNSIEIDPIEVSDS